MSSISTEINLVVFASVLDSVLKLHDENVGFLFVLTGPSYTAAAVYLIGYLVARTLHSIFYIASLQPHRTIAFAAGGVLTVAMLVQTLVAVARAG